MGSLMIMDLVRFVVTMRFVNWCHFIDQFHLVGHITRCLFDDGLELMFILYQPVSLVGSRSHRLGNFGWCHLTANILGKFFIFFAGSEPVDDQQADANGQQEGAGAKKILPITVGVARNGPADDQHTAHQEKDDTNVEAGNGAETFLIAYSFFFSTTYATARYCR